jgi:hypothetical protein
MLSILLTLDNLPASDDGCSRFLAFRGCQQETRQLFLRDIGCCRELATELRNELHVRYSRSSIKWLRAYVSLVVLMEKGTSMTKIQNELVILVA